MHQSMCIIMVWGYCPRGGGGAQTRSLSVQKTEKIIRAVPILKSNSTSFTLIFFSTMDIKNFTNYGGARGQAGGVEFIFLRYLYIISSM